MAKVIAIIDESEESSKHTVKIVSESIRSVLNIPVNFACYKNGSEFLENFYGGVSRKQHYLLFTTTTKANVASVAAAKHHGLHCPIIGMFTDEDAETVLLDRIVRLPLQEHTMNDICKKLLTSPISNDRVSSNHRLSLQDNCIESKPASKNGINRRNTIKSLSGRLRTAEALDRAETVQVQSASNLICKILPDSADSTECNHVTEDDDCDTDIVPKRSAKRLSRPSRKMIELSDTKETEEEEEYLWSGSEEEEEEDEGYGYGRNKKRKTSANRKKNPANRRPVRTRRVVKKESVKLDINSHNVHPVGNSFSTAFNTTDTNTGSSVTNSEPWFDITATGRALISFRIPITSLHTLSSNAIRQVFPISPINNAHCACVVEYMDDDFKSMFGLMDGSSVQFMMQENGDSKGRNKCIHTHNGKMTLEHLMGRGTANSEYLRMIQYITHQTNSNNINPVTNKDVNMNNSYSEYINLYRLDGTPLAAHLHMTSLSKTKEHVYTYDICNAHESIRYKEVLVTVSVRSESVIGNSKFCSIGLLDLVKLHQQTKEDALFLRNQRIATASNKSNVPKYKSVQEVQAMKRKKLPRKAVSVPYPSAYQSAVLNTFTASVNGLVAIEPSDSVCMEFGMDNYGCSIPVDMNTSSLDITNEYLCSDDYYQDDLFDSNQRF